jgi:hypothetical protein
MPSVPAPGPARASLARRAASRAARPTTIALVLALVPQIVAAAAGTPVIAGSLRDHAVPAGVGTIRGLQSFIDRVPNGTDRAHRVRILLGAGRTYSGTTGGLDLSGRRHLVLEGGGIQTPYGHTGGAVIAMTNPSASSTLRLNAVVHMFGGPGSYSATDLVFHGLTLRGGLSPTVAGKVGNLRRYAECNHGIAFWGVDGALVSHVIAEYNSGDGFYITDSLNGWTADGMPVRSRDVTIRHSTVRLNQRMGVAWIAGENTRVVRNEFRDIGMGPLDLEPNEDDQVIRNTVIAGNLISGGYSYDDHYQDAAFTVTAPSRVRAQVTGHLTIVGNRITAQQQNGTTDPSGQLNAYHGESMIKSAVLTFADNRVAGHPGRGNAVQLRGWKGAVTISGNSGFGSASFVLDGGRNRSIRAWSNS